MTRKKYTWNELQISAKLQMSNPIHMNDKSDIISLCWNDADKQNATDSLCKEEVTHGYLNYTCQV